MKSDAALVSNSLIHFVVDVSKYTQILYTEAEYKVTYLSSAENDVGSFTLMQVK